MRFCKNCDRAMTRNTSTGAVVFECRCGAEEPGGAEDCRIGGATLGASETAEMNSKLIQTASFDRTNQLVSRLCAACGRDYMTQIRVGDAEVVIYTCKCGAQESGAAGRGGKNAAGKGAPAPAQ